MGLNQLVPSWSLPRKLLFRFLCAYFALYILPFPLAEAARAEFLVRRWTGVIDLTATEPPTSMQWALKYGEMWQKVVRWTADNVLHLSEPLMIRPSGSGDATWNYVQVFCFAALAAAIAVLWSLVDWRPTNYARVREGLRIYVRFYVACQMIVYGTMKVVPAQMPPPALDRLVQPFGDASPMGLAWTFVGASPAYESFTGAGELLGGLLLTMRRTTLLGALVSAGVMAHVVLLAMSLWLMVPDLRRLLDVFILHRPSFPGPIEPWFRWWWLDWILVGLRTLIVGGFVYLQIMSAIQGREMFASQRREGPLYGVWDVEQFTVDGSDRPALVTEPDRWRRFIVDYPGSAGVQLTNASRIRYRIQINFAAGTITLRQADLSDWKAELTFSQPDDDHLNFDGTIDGRVLRIKMKREDVDEFLAQFRLINRGFHWINEFPFNR
jgi:hypothetical protein